MKNTSWGEGPGRLDAAGSTSQQPASARPRFGSTGLWSRDRYPPGRTDLERGLPRATGREERGQGAGAPKLG